jgi:hypothetical protein
MFDDTVASRYSTSCCHAMTSRRVETRHDHSFTSVPMRIITALSPPQVPAITRRWSCRWSGNGSVAKPAYCLIEDRCPSRRPQRSARTRQRETVVQGAPAAVYGEQLVVHQGIDRVVHRTTPPTRAPPRRAQSTALFQLAPDLPAASLARMLGIHITVADAWQRTNSATGLPRSAVEATPEGTHSDGVAISDVARAREAVFAEQVINAQ